MYLQHFYRMCDSHKLMGYEQKSIWPRETNRHLETHIEQMCIAKKTKNQFRITIKKTFHSTHLFIYIFEHLFSISPQAIMQSKI
jgi:hypothetical protein